MRGLTGGWEEGVVHAVLGEGTSGVGAVALQEAIFLERVALSGGDEARLAPASAAHFNGDKGHPRAC